MLQFVYALEIFLCYDRIRRSKAIDVILHKYPNFRLSLKCPTANYAEKKYNNSKTIMPYILIIQIKN